MIKALTCQLDKSLPKLGWLAIGDLSGDKLHIVHGEFVECCSEWLVEGAWDGEFKEGGFHKTDTFYGSGVRKLENKIYFVTSTAKTDRLLYCRDRDRIIVSNSLLLLLGLTGASLDENHDYVDEAISVVRDGLQKYKREFRIIHPRMQQIYQIFHENIVLENGEITYKPKNRKSPAFVSYNDYFHALIEKLQSVRRNYESCDRQRPMTAYTTISSGYDATAVSCLAKELGVKECFTGRSLDGWVFKRPAESSERIAWKLAYKINPLDPRRSSISRDELYFLAGNYPKFSKSVWSEISLHSMVKTLQKRNIPAVVLMGYHGDDMWGHKSKIDPETGELLATPPVSGLNLSEVRLLAGFVTLSPAYLYIKDAGRIKKISNSKEMEHWKLNNYYDRPIPRRIAEESGIPREWFGMKKRHITTTYIIPINKDNRRAFFQHLKVNMDIGKWYVVAYYLQKRILVGMLGMKILFGRNIDFYDLMRKWATEVLKKKYFVLLRKYN